MTDMITIEDNEATRAAIQLGYALGFNHGVNGAVALPFDKAADTAIKMMTDFAKETK